MAKVEEIPNVPQDFNYRKCAECNRTTHDQRIMERKEYVLLQSNIGHLSECPRR